VRALLGANTLPAPSVADRSPPACTGGSLAPLASLHIEGGAHVVLPDTAWSEGLLSCLADIATGQIGVSELPPVMSEEALLQEMGVPMESELLQGTFESLVVAASTPHMGSVIRMLVSLAQLDGPLRMLGGPPSPCDLGTFSQHLSALANQLNTLHDPNFLGKELQSATFSREKYELFALQHAQMLVWLQRVQSGLQQGLGKTGADEQQFVVQISHAARVLLFQPMLLHSVQVMEYVMSLAAHDGQSAPDPGSMRVAMAYPPDAASEADRVEWLQLNLLLQFQTIYKEALCNQAIYAAAGYSAGEGNLFAGFFRLEEIYTHLIGRFPASCPLTEQEQAVLTQLCQKLNKFFTDGKMIKACLEQNPGPQGKQLLVQSRVGPDVKHAQFAMRDWILPFMMVFTDLLKVLWTLWTHQKRRRREDEATRSACEGIARLVGEKIVAQLADEELALRAATLGSAAAAANHAAAAASAAAAAANHNAQSNAGGGGRGGQRRGDGGDGLAVGLLAAGGAAAGAPACNGSLDGGGVGWASVVRRPPVDQPPVQQYAPLQTSKQRSQEAAAAAAALAHAQAAALKRAVAAAPAPPAPAPAASGASAPEEAVRSLVAKREQARFSRDFEAADRLRDQLSKLGITLDDQVKSWRAADGRTGPITPVNVSELHAQKAARAGAASLDDADISRLVREREQARYTGDYKTADRLRDQLEKHGVHLDARDAKWQAADGRFGPILPVNISAAHAQKAARAGAPRLTEEEVIQ